MSSVELKKSLTVGELAEKTGCRLRGASNTAITGVNSLEEADIEHISFLNSPKHLAVLLESDAGAFIVNKEIEQCDKPQLITDNVDKTLIDVLNLFAPVLSKPPAGIHPSAVIEENADIDASASVGPHSYISKNVKIGAGCVISANCSIGENCVIGDNTRIDAGVSVYHNCRIGRNCIIQSNTVIGSTGFGYSFIEGGHRLIPHNGGVIIEDCVETGPGCAIDRAKFGNTIIGAGTKLDNLVQIAHNVKIGKCCLIASQVGISGSCVIGNGVAMGGQVGMVDHLNVGDGAMIGAQSGLMRDLSPGDKVMGSPPNNLNRQLKIYSVTRRLPEMSRELKQLSKKVSKLEASKDN